MDACIHPLLSVKVKEVTFKNGSKHLERRCGICDKHMGYQSQAHNMGSGKKIHFGQYDGKTFEWVAEHDRDYFEWLLEKPDLQFKLRRVIIETLNRVKKADLTPPVLSPEMQEMKDQVEEMRAGGLDYFKKIADK